MKLLCRGDLIGGCILLLAGCWATQGHAAQASLVDGWYWVAPVEARQQFDLMSGAKEAVTQQQRQQEDLGRKGCFGGQGPWKWDEKKWSMGSEASAGLLRKTTVRQTPVSNGQEKA